MLLRDADVASLNRLPRGWIQLPRVSIKHPDESRADANRLSERLPAFLFFSPPSRARGIENTLSFGHLIFHIAVRTRFVASRKATRSLARASLVLAATSWR